MQKFYRNFFVSLLVDRDALQEQLLEAKLVMDAITKGVELMRTDLEKMKAQNMYCRVSGTRKFQKLRSLITKKKTEKNKQKYI